MFLSDIIHRQNRIYGSGSFGSFCKIHYWQGAAHLERDEWKHILYGPVENPLIVVFYLERTTIM